MFLLLYRYSHHRLLLKSTQMAGHEKCVCAWGHTQPGLRSVIPLFNLYLTQLDLDLCPYPLPFPPALSILFHLSPYPATCWHALLSLSHITSSPLCPPCTASWIPSQERDLIITHTQPPHPLAGFVAEAETHTWTDKQEGGLVVGWVGHITIIDPQAVANWLSPVCLRYTMPLHSPVITH